MGDTTGLTKADKLGAIDAEIKAHKLELYALEVKGRVADKLKKPKITEKVSAAMEETIKALDIFAEERAGVEAGPDQE